MQEQFKIYTDDYYGNIEVDYGRGYFSVYPAKITPKMREYLRGVIRNHHWDIHWHVSSSGETGYGYDPIYHTTFTSAEFSWKTLEARHHMSWVLLEEPYIGSPFEQGLDALIDFGRALRRIRNVFDDIYWIFKGGLFSKPDWLKTRKERFDNLPF